MSDALRIHSAEGDHALVNKDLVKWHCIMAVLWARALAAHQ